MSLYLGDELIAGAGTPTLDTRNVGQIIQSVMPLSDAGLHLLDGSLLANGSYSAFISYMASMYVSCPEIFDTESNWQQSVAEYDVCGKFVYDSANNTVRLPKLLGTSRYLIKSEVNGTEWYRIYSDGWCEQGGYLGDTTFSTKTISLPVSYNDTNFTILTSVKDSSGAHNFRFTKNSSSSITFNRAGDSNCTGHWMTSGYTNISSYNVEPLYQYIVIANSTKTEIEADIDEIATDLNGKADVDLSNVSSTGKNAAVNWIMPDYANGISVPQTSNSTWTQVAKDSFVIVWGYDPYTEEYNVYVSPDGGTTSYRVGYRYDDTNRNTQTECFSFFIPKGWYFCCMAEAGYAAEIYPLKGAQ